MSLNWFAKILVHHPCIVLIVISVFSGTCLIIPIIYVSFPNFSDPHMGFETRGTELSNRITTWKNLFESTRQSGPFAVNPKEFLNRKNHSIYFKPKKKKHSKRIKTQGIGIQNIFVSEKSNYSAKTSQNNWKKLRILVDTDHPILKIHPPLNDESYFCGPPDEGYAQLVYKSDDDSSLFNLEALFKLCRLEMELVQAQHFKELCVMTVQKPTKCCKPWSLANYVALLNDRTSCLAITEEDVNNTKSILMQCSKFYHNLNIAPDCYERGHCEAPKDCIKHDAVYNIFNYLISTSFLPPNRTDDNDLVLKETMIFLPLACSTATLPYYYNLQDIHLNYKGISVVAMEFGIKTAVFDKCLLADMWLITAGGIFVLLCIWVYTKSLFITLMTIIAILFSLGISYFVYTCIFKFGFFPFMNLLAAIVAIGIGADDAFIFCNVWTRTKREDNSSLLQIMSDTLYHAIISMLVTSLSTAAAFIASYFSCITAIRCFGVFAGIAVIANYLLMISWLPACIVLWEKTCFTYCGIIKSGFLVFLERWCCLQQWKLSVSRFRTSCASLDKLWLTPESYILDAVIKLKFFFFILLTIVAIISSVVVFYYPKLELPNNNEFQLFDSRHHFEQYDMVYKYKFWFKRMQKGDDANSLAYKLPLRFVWGVLPQDNGNYMDPQSLGELELDDSFEMSDPESQKWLLNFCKTLRKQPFYQSTLGPLLPNCFIESFTSWMQRRCFDPIDNMDRSPCCESSEFPYNTTVFEVCILEAISDLYETPSEYFIPGMAGPKFSKDQFPTIKAVVVEYDSNYSFSMSYDYMNNFVSKVNDWMINQLSTAPDSMKGGWFISDVEFFDLQRALSESTLYAVCISMSLALIVLFLSTLNILISLYAIFTITCSITTTMALLVLAGWKLNILEAVAVSSAIGLTIDFSLHYTVNYKLCPISVTENRESATRYALSNMLGPATMAAITTGAAGAFMMPSEILAYKQIGQFLLTVMSVSWIYSTFHLGSLLAIAGPERQYGQYYYSKLFMCCKKNKTTVNEQRVRDDMAGTSSMSDTYELDLLSSKCDLRLHESLQRSVSGGGIGRRSHTSMFLFSDQSPSATSAITVIMADDN